MCWAMWEHVPESRHGSGSLRGPSRGICEARRRAPSVPRKAAFAARVGQSATVSSRARASPTRSHTELRVGLPHPAARIKRFPVAEKSPLALIANGD